MMDVALLRSIASQLMTMPEVEVGGQRVRVQRTSLRHLKTVTFAMNGREYMAIEQNPDKPSLWGKLARKGHQVVQFKDIKTNRFVAVVVDEEVKVYGEMARRTA